MTMAAARSATIDFYDDFNRSGALGRGWITGHDLAATTYETVALDGTGAVVSDPFARGPLTSYEPEALIESNPHPPVGGKWYAGISYAVRDCPGWALPDVEVTWAGWRGTITGQHVEAGPLLYVDPANPLGGFGVWMAAFGASSASDGSPAMYVGCIGSPPELFGTASQPAIAVAAYTHVDGTPMRVRLKMVSTGVANVYLNGVLQSFGGSRSRR